jgi:hypothetical protein
MNIPLTNISGGHAAANRIDPYWAALWSQGSQAAWLSANVAARQIDAGLGTLPHYLHLDSERAWKHIRGPAMNRYLDVLAVLDVWRTATSEQIAALTGHTSLANGRSTIYADLFAAGLIDVGIFSNALNTTLDATRANLYRPSRSNTFDRQLRPHLTYAEWVSVTGGYPFESGGQYDRHNILTTEMALRATEMAEVAAVLGEKLSTWDLLAHSGCGYPPAVGRARHADATIIRTDGMRIAIETTASFTGAFEAKARRWAELLSNKRLADTGLTVIFLVAARPDQISSTAALTDVRKKLAAAVRDHAGVDFDRTAEKLMVASWTDWFPQAGHTTPQFATLDAYRPTGPAGNPWEPVSALDVIDLPFQPATTFNPHAIINNLSMLRSQPARLRRGTPPQLWPTAITETGFNGVPVPAPTRPETYVGKPLGKAFGVSGNAQPPRRLLSQL